MTAYLIQQNNISLFLPSDTIVTKAGGFLNYAIFVKKDAEMLIGHADNIFLVHRKMSIYVRKYISRGFIVVCVS